MRYLSNYAAALLVGFIFLSSAEPRAEAANRVEVRDGVAISHYGSRELKVGKVSNDQVAIFNSFGGGTKPLKEVEQLLTKVPEVTEYKAQLLAVRDALTAKPQPAPAPAEKKSTKSSASPSRIEGIWRMQSQVTGGKETRTNPDNLTYLVIRDDKSFRVIKTGRKPVGTWEEDADGRFVFKFEGGLPETSGKLNGKVLGLSVKQNDSETLLRYVRTNLTKEPKAADE